MQALPPADRPREKLRRLGTGALGDNELLALVLGTGSRRRAVLDVANEVLRRRGGLHGLVRSTVEELGRISGIGSARASQVLAALELGRRTLAPAPGTRVMLRTPRDAAQFLLPTFGARASEAFGIVLLDNRHRVLRTSVLATGTSNATVVEPRDVFREAMLGSATSIVVFHNHPSGDPSPSQADLAMTRRLVAAGVLMGIELVDHLVLGDARYCSMKEMGQL
jgi:DNA repair protein RadC